MGAARLDLDPSRPYQLGDGLLAIWLPRGRGRDDRAQGLLAAVFVCPDIGCTCSRVVIAALPIDDGLRSAKPERRGIKLTWKKGSERPRAPYHQLLLDFRTGELTDARGEKIDAALVPFFQKPVPAWVLDAIHDTWASLRPPLAPWFEQALRNWHPDEMLPLMAADPGARLDMYVLEGERYAVDFVFCVQPGCKCTQNRMLLFGVDDFASPDPTWTEIASAEIDDNMELRKAEGSREHQSALSSVYLAWRDRAGNPSARFAELRARAMERGVVLHALWSQRGLARPTPTAAPLDALSRPMAPAPSATVRPIAGGKQGRNDPCACGSGRKHKRCCGA